MLSIRKNITLPQADYEAISMQAKRMRISFSELLRKSAMDAIKKNEEADLLTYLMEHCPVASTEEQADFDRMTFDEADDGREITLNELLQS